MKASKISIKNMSKSFSSMKDFMKIFMIVFFKILTDCEKSIHEMFRSSNIFCCLGRGSSVVGLFISFLTSGLSFVKNCWGLILWCLGGLVCFIFYLLGNLGCF